MRNIIIGTLAVTLIACGNPDERFLNTYAEIVATRMQYPDTATANPLVRSVLKRNGYTEATFRHEFSTRAGKPEQLRQLIDSARVRAMQLHQSQVDTQQHPRK